MLGTAGSTDVPHRRSSRPHETACACLTMAMVAHLRSLRRHHGASTPKRKKQARWPNIDLFGLDKTHKILRVWRKQMMKKSVKRHVKEYDRNSKFLNEKDR